MKIKERARDFRVEELISISARPRGAYALYRLTKERRNTLDVVSEVARALGVRKKEISIGGLKDYDARTVQYLTVPGGPARDLEFQRARVEFRGRTGEPLGREHLGGNRFEVVVRDLSLDQARRAAPAFRRLARSGVPNYFDDQRFGSVKRGADFPFKRILRGEPEEALRLLFATPSRYDTPPRRRRGRRIQGRWGRWAGCLAAGETPSERAVFGHLRAHPGDFDGALGRLERPFLLLLAFSYQSFIFNETLSRLVRRTVSPHARSLRYRPGWFVFPTQEGLGTLGELEGRTAPLPGYGGGTRDPEVGGILEGVLHKEGVTEGELGRPQLKSVQLRWEERPAVVRPVRASCRAPRKDELHGGRSCLTLHLTLPRNVYATVFLRALEALTGIERTQNPRKKR
jgi:tRNA pseudouridine13 synthase